MLVKYGLEGMAGDPMEILHRHLVNNHAAAIGGWESTARRWQERAEKAEQPAAGLDPDRLTAIIESRMSRDLAWLRDDGTTVDRFNPEQVGWALAHLYQTGDVVSGLPPLPAQPARPANHYEWFMPEDPTAAVDDYLDEFEAKMREALTDPFVHDMAQSVLPLIAAYRAARPAEAALPYEDKPCDVCGEQVLDAKPENTRLWRNEKGTLVGLFGHVACIEGEYASLYAAKEPLAVQPTPAEEEG